MNLTVRTVERHYGNINESSAVRLPPVNILSGTIATVKGLETIQSVVFVRTIYICITIITACT